MYSQYLLKRNTLGTNTTGRSIFHRGATIQIQSVVLDTVVFSKIHTKKHLKGDLWFFYGFKVYFSRTLCGRFCQAYQFRYTIFRMNVILSTMQTGIICNEFGSNCIGFVIPHCDFLLKYITPNTNSGCFNTLRPKQNCRHFPKHFNERKCMIFA